MHSMEQKKKNKVVGSASGAEYILEKELGQGAQGKVYSIRGGKYALKVLGKKTSKKGQLLGGKISYVKTRDIADLAISKPIEQIEGSVLGYIMEMATDMMSLEKLIIPTGDIINWWKETGGLKKRLEILKKLSKILRDLHSRGLIYGDLSMNNVFVSDDANYSEIYLIDSDNITHECKIGKAIYTPGYGAPEVVNGTSGNDTYTDDFSFSVIAYQLLTLNHPFIGDYVNDGDPDLEDEAYLGNIPWVNSSIDSRNIASTGLPHSITISKNMMDAFTNTFETNLHNKTKRTTSAKWFDILSISINFLLKCKKEDCKTHFFYAKERKCRFCGYIVETAGFIKIFPNLSKLKKKAILDYGVNLDKFSKKQTPILGMVLSVSEDKVITGQDIGIGKEEDKLYSLKLSNDTIIIKGINQKTISIIIDRKYKEDIPINNFVRLPITDLYLLPENINSDYCRVIKITKI